ncbi:MAG: autotransporter assembly complex family protein [Pseudomonadota bacterium]
MKYWLGAPSLILILSLASKIAVGGNKITVNGVEGPLEENIRQHLTLSERQCDAPQWRLQAAREDAEGEIIQALQALGYYDPSINTGELLHDDDCWSISFDITPGKPVRIRGIHIKFEQDAATDNHFREIRKELPAIEGEILNHGNYTSSKEAVQTLALERGYFDAELTEHQLLVDPEHHSAEIRLTLASGSRYRFGSVNISSDTIDQELLERLVTITPDGLYSSDEIYQFQQSLNDSGYFDSAAIREQHDREQHTVNLDVTLTPRKKHAIGFGIGASTDAGLRVSSNYENRYVNSRGHNFKSRIRVDLLGINLDALYSIPLQNPTREWFSFMGQIESVETNSSERNTARAGIRMTKLRSHDWLETRYLTLKSEEYVIDNEPGRAMPLIPGVSWTRIRKDGQQRIHKGERLHLEFRGAVHDFSEGSPFFQAIASGNWINSPWDKGRFISRLDLGLTLVDDVNNLAASDRFFTGGDTSIRGYEYQDLGPVNARNNVTGGEHLAVASLEYEHYLDKGWSLAAFVDSGNAFNNGAFSAKTGIGVGVRWLSPLGPIKVDLAHPLDDDETDVRFVFRMGPEF